jgi:ABC-type enterobactin transport system permease subunit
VKAQKLVSNHLPTKLKWLGWVQCGLLFALILMPVWYKPEGQLEPIALIVSMVILVVLLTTNAMRRALVSLHFNQIDGKEIWYEFDEQGLRFGMPGSETRLGWPLVVAAIESEALVVFQSGALFYTIPKRALTAEDVIGLKTLAEQKVTTGW